MDIAVGIMAGGLLFAGSTIDSGPGGWIGAEARIAWISLGAEARGIFIDAKSHSLSPSGSDLVRVSGLVVPCLRWKVLLGCGFVELGQLTLSIPGGFESAPAGVISAGPRAGIDIPLLGGFSLRGFADLAVHPRMEGFLGAGLAWSR